MFVKMEKSTLGYSLSKEVQMNGRYNMTKDNVATIFNQV